MDASEIDSLERIFFNRMDTENEYECQDNKNRSWKYRKNHSHHSEKEENNRKKYLLIQRKRVNPLIIRMIFYRGKKEMCLFYEELFRHRLKYRKNYSESKKKRTTRVLFSILFTTVSTPLIATRRSTRMVIVICTISSSR